MHFIQNLCKVNIHAKRTETFRMMQMSYLSYIDTSYCIKKDL